MDNPIWQSLQLLSYPPLSFPPPLACLFSKRQFGFVMCLPHFPTEPKRKTRPLGGVSHEASRGPDTRAIASPRTRDRGGFIPGSASAFAFVIRSMVPWTGLWVRQGKGNWGGVVGMGKIQYRVHNYAFSLAPFLLIMFDVLKYPAYIASTNLSIDICLSVCSHLEFRAWQIC